MIRKLNNQNMHDVAGGIIVRYANTPENRFAMTKEGGILEGPEDAPYFYMVGGTYNDYASTDLQTIKERASALDRNGVIVDEYSHPAPYSLIPGDTWHDSLQRWG